MGFNVVPAPEVSGLTGAPGAQGLKGDKGSSILTGTTVPASSVGIDGDWYFMEDTRTFLGVTSTTWTIYQKAAGAWAVVGNTLGGSKIYLNNASTSSTDTKPGDILIRTDTGDMWQRSASGWGSPIGNIRGPQGIQGIQGIQGVAGPQGPEGPQGIKGDTGAQGPAGTSLTFRGGWAAGVAYAVNDMARYNGSTYRVTTAHTSSTTSPGYPDVATGHYAMVAQKGDTGPQGDKGDKGDTGDVGPAGPAGGIPLTGEVSGVNVALKGNGTNNIQEWKNPSGSIISRIGANGNFVAQGAMYAVGGIQVGSTSTDFGGGSGPMIGLDDAVTLPSTNPTSGVVIYSEAGSLKYRKPDGTVVTVGEGGAGTGTVKSINTKLPDVNGNVALTPTDIGAVDPNNATLNDFMVINATAPTNYGIVALRKLNKKRWMFAVSGSQETGSDAGSNFMIQSYSDAEADKTVHFYGERSSGSSVVGSTQPMNGARLTVDGGGIGIVSQAADPITSSLGPKLYSKTGRLYVQRGTNATPGGPQQWEVQPRADEWLPEDLGLKAWSSDPVVCQSNGAFTGTTGIRITAVRLREAQLINRLCWHFLGYAGGLQTGSWAALYNSSGTRVATSGDLSTATYEPAEQHGSGGGLSSAPLTATYTAVAGVYYIAWRFIYNTTTGDGPMLLQYENSAGAPPNVFGYSTSAVKRFGVISGTSLTASPASITTSSIENGANRFWAALA
ncbi:minor tail protein [Streptomyces phage Verse]|uniref:Minor tail protein n=1 Tax=Streptomyces phage Verse TaxID=1673878 RepID=A0A0K1Y9T6_9CAUD|nr:minor tail protein [Streptomyces phage Verse]